MKMWFILVVLTLASLTVSASVDDCPGYVATNVTNSTTSFTASLTLAGTACNAFGEDIQDLQLVVEYQSGKQSDNIERR